MKGLLLKDWYLTIRYARTLVLISAFFMISLPFSSANMFMRIYPCAMAGLLPSTLFSYDEREKWIIYAQSFPISRALYVTEKYLFGVLALSVNLVFVTVVHLIVGIENFTGFLLIALTVGLLIPALLLPMMLYFGAEKGRILYFIVIGATCASAFGIGQGAISTALTIAIPFSWQLVCLIIVAVYVISWRISVALYEKREM